MRLCAAESGHGGPPAAQYAAKFAAIHDHEILMGFWVDRAITRR
jgi:hypothetical protein